MTFTVVICQGAWPLLVFSQPLAQAFESRNHPAICKIRESYPAHDPNAPPSINPDCEYLRTEVLEPAINDGADIVLFMHSYGGVYGPESIKGLSKKERESKGLKGGIIATVHTAACVAPTGTTALQCMGIDPANLPSWVEYDAATHAAGITKDYAKKVLFSDLPEEEAEKLANALPKQPLTTLATPTHWDPYGDAYYKGKMAYIYTEKDKIVPYEYQKSAVAQVGIEHTYLLEGSSHSPHLEQPERLADIIIELVKKMTEKSE